MNSHLVLSAPSPTATAATASAAPIVCALVMIDGPIDLWLETIINLAHMDGLARLCLAGPGLAQPLPEALEQCTLSVIEADDLKGATAELSERFDLLLVVTAPVVASADALSRASKWMAKDPRFATVSFLSNTAGYLSFPYHNRETPVGPDMHNETTLTRHLRETAPDQGPVPISIPEGGMILVSAGALDVCSGFASASGLPAASAVLEFGLRASRRGFNNFLDCGTYVTRPWESPRHLGSVVALDAVRDYLSTLHHFFPALHDDEIGNVTSPLNQALDLARAKVMGLRILIDGSVLGPQEMGTQLLIVALSQALAAEPGVGWIGVGVPDPHNLPAYARVLAATPKINLLRIGDLDFPDAPHVDIIHRPFQPTGPIPWQRWRELSKRSVITIQDLIAYRNGAYFRNYSDWGGYRRNLKYQVSQADAIFSISKDVVNPILEERLPVSADAVHVVENGIDYRSGDQPARIPAAMLDHPAARFMIVLGATYTHKNRDLAIRVWMKLKERGHRIVLVLVGATVPFGSTRIEEAVLLLGPRDDVVNLPSVSGEERNWLLKHMDLALYTTAAEGFGQIPFEAAQFDKPSLYVSFGPLKELIGDDEAPETFMLDDLVARAEQLLTEPDAAARAIQKIRDKIGVYSWQQTAKRSVEAYFKILSRPIQ